MPCKNLFFRAFVDNHPMGLYLITLSFLLPASGWTQQLGDGTFRIGGGEPRVARVIHPWRVQDIPLSVEVYKEKSRPMPLTDPSGVATATRGGSREYNFNQCPIKRLLGTSTDSRNRDFMTIWFDVNVLVTETSFAGENVPDPVNKLQGAFKEVVDVYATAEKSQTKFTTRFWDSFEIDHTKLPLVEGQVLRSVRKINLFIIRFSMVKLVISRN